MSPQCVILNLRTGQVILARADVRAGFFSRLIGLQLRSSLGAQEGMIFVCARPGRLAAAVHTLGLRFAIGLVWLDAELKVVDKKLALPGRFAHVPKASAMYYLEANPAILDLTQIGDQLRIDEVIA